MNKKLLIFGGIFTTAIAISCVGASASTITQDTYYSDDVFFPKGQYQMNFNFEIGAASSTSNDYNFVIYNDVIPRDVAEVDMGSYASEIYDYMHFQESVDNNENIDLITYWTSANGFFNSSIKQVNNNIEFSDSSLLNNDLYFRFNDFFYMASDYKGHSLKWTNSSNYFQAWLDEDFNIYDDLGFIDYTIFTLDNGVVSSQRYIDGISSTNIFTYYSNGVISFDTFLIETIKNKHSSFYAFYINDCVLKMTDLYYYDTNLHFESLYYNYDNTMFERIGNFDYTTPDIDVSDFIISSVGGFMDFQIIPGFSFGLLLSFILTLALIVWIIKVFMGG